MIRVTEPADRPVLPGQYTTLVQGCWEPRADEAHDNLKPDQDQKMARRSYSVSSSMIDEAESFSTTHPGCRVLHREGQARPGGDTRALPGCS